MKDFERANAETLRLAPQSATIRCDSGDAYLRAVAGAKNLGQFAAARDAAQRAVADYRQTTTLYPNNALYHAKLAVACRAVGDGKAFAEAARTALRLDEITPHSVKKLPSALRTQLSQDLHNL